MNNKKLISSLILSFLLFGTASTIKTSSNNRLEVKDVLSENLNDFGGRAVTPRRASEVSTKTVADEVKVQQRTNEDGTYDIRFLAGINSYELNRTVFHVTINNGTKDVSKDVTVTSAYTGLEVGEETLTSAEIFGEGYDYLVAYAITGIPSAALDYTYSASLSIFETAEGESLDSSEVKSTTLQELVDADNPVDEVPYAMTLKHEGAQLFYTLSWTNDNYDINKIVSFSGINTQDMGVNNVSRHTETINNSSNSIADGYITTSGANYSAPPAVDKLVTFTMLVETTNSKYFNINVEFISTGNEVTYVTITSLTVEEFIVSTYNVTFDLNYDNAGTYATLEQINEQKYSLPSNPSREGYSFLGWYTAPEGGDKINDDSIVNLSENIVLYAHWVKQITITFDAGEGTCSSTSSVIDQGKSLTNLPQATLDGYIFLGWYTAPEGGDKITTEYTFDSSTTIYAQFKSASETVINKLPIKTSNTRVEGAGVFIYFTDSNAIISNTAMSNINIVLNSVKTDFPGYKTYESSIKYNGIVHTNGCIYFTISAGLGVQAGYYFDFDFTISLTTNSGDYYESNLVFRNNALYTLDGVEI